jgi:transcriptional regulator with XRE-family HTH domain
MTDEVSEKVKQAIAQKGISQAEYARQLGISRAQLGQYLNGDRGQLPDTWHDILSGLGLELTVRPKE